MNATFGATAGKIVHLLLEYVMNPAAVNAAISRLKADITDLVNTVHGTANTTTGTTVTTPTGQPVADVTITGAPGTAIETHPG